MPQRDERQVNVRGTCVSSRSRASAASMAVSTLAKKSDGRGGSLRNMFGGRSQGYEEELTNARTQALAEMQRRAEAMGAHAVIGVDVDYEVLGTDGSMLMVTASGTAVQIARAD